MPNKPLPKIKEENVILLTEIADSIEELHDGRKKEIEEEKKQSFKERIESFKTKLKSFLPATSKQPSSKLTKNVALATSLLGISSLVLGSIFKKGDIEERGESEISTESDFDFSSILKDFKIEIPKIHRPSATPSVPETAKPEITAPPPIPSRSSESTVKKEPVKYVKVDPKEVYSYLKGKGLSDNHIIGIMANIEAESSWRVNVIANEYSAGRRYLGQSGGLFQLHKSRFTALKKAVPNWETNWKGQIDFALKDDVAPQYLRTSFKSHRDATKWWTVRWERPANAKLKADQRAQISDKFIVIAQTYRSQSTKLESASRDNISLEEKNDPTRVILFDNRSAIANVQIKR